MAHGKCCLVLACLVVSVSAASAFVFKAGGTGEWRMPGESNGNGNVSSYNRWAEQTRFGVGDAIAFSYQPGNDSVLLVDKKSYDACDASSPTDTFADGNTVFTFTRSGPFYFISGNKDNCNRNEKLVVVVMAKRDANGTATPPMAPLPGSSPFSPPIAPLPSSSPFSPPSPAPPLGFEISPTANPPPPNAAAPKAAGIAGTAALAIGTLFYAFV